MKQRSLLSFDEGFASGKKASADYLERLADSGEWTPVQQGTIRELARRLRAATPTMKQVRDG